MDELRRKGDKMNEFHNYLIDKKVIIVGPAYYLKDKQQGNYINNFDIVVRINEPMHAPISKQDKIDFGYKTNIIYLPLSLTKIFVTQTQNKTGAWGKRITFSDKDRKEVYDRWKSRGVKWVVGRNKARRQPVINFNYLNMTEGWVKRVAKKANVSRVQTSGILAINHLLESDLKLLNIIGFDFYQTGYYYDKNNWKIGRPKIGTKGNPHLKYFKQLVEKEDRLIIGDHLKGILDAN